MDKTLLWAAVIVCCCALLAWLVRRVLLARAEPPPGQPQLAAMPEGFVLVPAQGRRDRPAAARDEEHRRAG